MFKFIRSIFSDKKSNSAGFNPAAINAEVSIKIKYIDSVTGREWAFDAGVDVASLQNSGIVPVSLVRI